MKCVDLLETKMEWICTLRSHMWKSRNSGRAEIKNTFLKCVTFFFFFHWRYSPGWAKASFKRFRHSSRLIAVFFQFLNPTLDASSSILSSQRNLGLPLGRCPPVQLITLFLQNYFHLTGWHVLPNKVYNILNIIRLKQVEWYFKCWTWCVISVLSAICIESAMLECHVVVKHVGSCVF
jgi:hypothetical protein